MLDNNADPGAAAPFDPGQYPRTYRLRASARWASVVLALGVASLGAYLVSPANASRSPGSYGEWGAAALLLLPAIWFLALGQRTRLVLSVDSLTCRGAFLSRQIAIAHVLGRRRAPNSRHGVRLIAKPGHGRDLRVSGDLKRDAQFDAWFARIPDLDAIELAASLAQVLQDRTLGATPGDVQERLVRARRWATIGTVASFAVLIEMRFSPLLWDNPVDVAIAMCLPVVALLAAGLARGLVTLTPIDKARNDARPSLFPMLLLPSIGVLCGVPLQSNIEGWQPFLLPALVGGALGSAYAMAFDVDLRTRIGGALATFVGMAAFAAAAFVWLDVHADIRAARPIRAAVTTRWADKSPGLVIGLGPANTAFDWTHVRAMHADQADLQIGSVACLTEHPGLLGLRWAELHRCAGDPAITPEQAAHHWLARVARPASQREPLFLQLAGGDWPSVDAALNAIQKRFENGDATAVDVERAFDPLASSAPALDAPLADWLAHAPDSWAAHVAAALHAEHQSGWLFAGGFSERDSPAFNWQERARFAQAQAQASIRLSSRPALGLMVTYRVTANRWKVHPDWVDRMLAIDPEDVSMRREYLIQHPICPCHDLSPADPSMATLLRTNPSQRVRDTLAAYRLFERGVDAGNTARAIALYTQALALHPYPQDAYSSHINVAVALIDAHRLDEAVTELKTAIATLPGNRHAHEELGYVYELQDRKPQALAEFLVDAERGQSWAQMRAGSFLLTPEPGVALDRQAGARWMREAANGGEARARDILRRHPDLMAEYPPTY